MFAVGNQFHDLNGKSTQSALYNIVLCVLFVALLSNSRVILEEDFAVILYSLKCDGEKLLVIMLADFFFSSVCYNFFPIQ